MKYLAGTILVGVGATAAMDLWAMLRARLLGVPALNYGLVGRWVAWLMRGRFRHSPIAASPSVRGERLIGWVAHYVIGISFAALLVAIYGTSWLEQPTLAPALLVGIGTVAAPFLVMQPAMGAGIAASRTPNPASARLQSLVTHAVFGAGLFAAGWLGTLLYARPM
jgi:Protein of unknown function (DUF2938)